MQAISSQVNEGNDILLLALNPFRDLPQSKFRQEVLVVIGRHQNIFRDELHSTYTICWPTCFLKGDEARHKVLPSSICGNSAQIAYHPCEIYWKICVVSHNHVRITIASFPGPAVDWTDSVDWPPGALLEDESPTESRAPGEWEWE